jgi:hemoglobin
MLTTYPDAHDRPAPAPLIWRAKGKGREDCARLSPAGAPHRIAVDRLPHRPIQFGHVGGVRAAQMNHGSMFEKIGGDAVVRPAVALFYQRVLDDPELSDHFKGVDLARLRAHQRAFVTAVLGGPALFGGRPLEVAHAGLEITDHSFDAMVEHLVAALRDLGVQEKFAADVVERLESFRSRVVSLDVERRG